MNADPIHPDNGRSTPEKVDDVLLSIRRSQRIGNIATAILYLAVTAAVVWTVLTTKKIHDGVCTFRSDLRSRVLASEDFLAQHPGKEPFPGVPRQTILTSIDGQKQTYGSLSSVGCSGQPDTLQPETTSTLPATEGKP